MKLQAINSTKINSVKNTSFKGYETKVKNDGKKVLEFYAPPYDKNKYTVSLELVTIGQEISGEGNNKVPMWQATDDFKRTYKSIEENGVETGKFELSYSDVADFESQEFSDNKNNKINAFGYRFVYTDKENPSDFEHGLEPGLKTNNGVEDSSHQDIYNVYLGRIGSVKKRGPMYHMFPDSYYNVNWNEQPPKMTATRNHFNLLGGNIKGIIEKVRDGKFDNYGLLMTTPLFGADEMSSHGYWPTNPYQISAPKGDLQDFKDLNFELYKRGVQYVADGAFTSNGLLSPLVQHVIKYGKDSQFCKYFRIDGKENSETGKFKLYIPILPETDDDLKNITYKLVYKNGETYIQFYDTRLVSKQDTRNNDEFIKSYDPKLVEKYPNISAHDHSVVPYYFNISNEIGNNGFKEMVENQGKPLTELGLDFTNFAVVTKKDARSANFWDGNLDLIKMNAENENVQKYLINIANYWTKTIANTLLFETAALNKTDPNEVENIALNNGISKKDFDEIKKNVASGAYNSVAFENLYETKNLIAKEIAKFPLEAIEFAPEITAALASPDMGGTTPEEIENSALDGYYNKIDNNIDKNIKEILEHLDKAFEDSPQQRIFEDEKRTKLTRYGAIIAKAIIPDVVKYHFAHSILGEKYVEFTKDGVKIKENNVGLSHVTNHANTLEKEKSELVKHLEGNPVRGAELTKIEKVYEDKFKNLTYKDLLLAQAIIEKSGAGLNWRYDAAKDIADLDATRGSSADFESAFDTAAVFWKNFTNEVKKENPNAFTIGEITGMNEFDGAAANTRYFNDKVAERSFYEKTGITTGSNYTYLYSFYPELLDRSTEHGSYNWKKPNRSDNDGCSLAKTYAEFYKAGTLPFINNSHVFTDNHDKPRTMHGFVFDTGILTEDVDADRLNVGQKNRFDSRISGKNQGGAAVNNDEKDVLGAGAKKRIMEINAGNRKAKEYGLNPYIDPDYLYINPYDDTITSRGVAGYDLFVRAIEQTIQKKDKELEARLKCALKELLVGDKNMPKEERKMRSKALGTRPVEVTMELLLDKAGINDANKRKEITDDLNSVIFKNAFDKYTTMWRMMVAGAGIPTIFSGDEYGQTGYETPTKNQDLGCRNRVLFERENKNDMFSSLYDEVNATSNLHKQKGLSALSGGTADIAVIGNTQIKEDAMAFYKYDSNGSEVLSILWRPFTDNSDQNANKPNSSFGSDMKPYSDDAIILEETDASGSIELWVNENKEFKKKIYDKNTREYVDSDETYVLEDGMLKNKDNEKEVVLEPGVNIFYRVDNLKED